MQREITNIYRNLPLVDNGQLLAFRLLPLKKIESLGPFVFCDNFYATGGRGMGQSPHPHAGIELISYLLKGRGEHRDSKGFVDQIKAGESQHIKAGSGILHAETPLESIRQGLQLWLSLPPEHQFDDPTYAAYRAESIPTINYRNTQIKVIAGKLNDLLGPITTVRESLLAHIQFNDNSEVTIEVNENLELGAFVMNGQASISGKAFSLGDIAVLNNGKKITIKSEGDQFPVDVAILGGVKINYPLVFHGPFVMDTWENILRAYRDFYNGNMGTLD